MTHAPVHRFPLSGGRELRATRVRGRIVITVRLIGEAIVSSGPLEVAEGDIQALATAIEVLRIETAIEGGEG